MTEPISRRSLITTSGATLAGSAVAQFLPASALAQQDSYTPWPDWQINWRVHKTTGLAAAIQIPDGVRITTPDAESTVDQTTIALWAKKRVGGDFELTFAYKVTDRLDVAGGSFACFYLCTLGQGSDRSPVAVPNWRRVTLSDQVYADHSRSLRFSFAIHNPGRPNIDHRLRLRWFNKTPSPTLVEPASPAVFPFTDGVAYDMAVRRAGNRLRVLVAPAAGSGEEPQTFGWEDDAIGRWPDGHIGFR
jgi:hypothetical protein